MQNYLISITISSILKNDQSLIYVTATQYSLGNAMLGRDHCFVLAIGGNDEGGLGSELYRVEVGGARTENEVTRGDCHRQMSVSVEELSV
jgi:hypothetical protein